MKFKRAPGQEIIKDDDPSLIVREDGRVEKLCKHGIGHPVGTLPHVVWQDWMGVHGCDGCEDKAEFYLQ